MMYACAYVYYFNLGSLQGLDAMIGLNSEEAEELCIMTTTTLYGAR